MGELEGTEMASLGYVILVPDAKKNSKNYSVVKTPPGGEANTTVE